MGLNIVPTRKYSLKGFAEGWDDAYIIVNAASERQRQPYVDAMLAMRQEMREAIAAEDKDKIQMLGDELDLKADAKMREFALELIQGGKVVTTNEDGTTELVAFEKADVPTVLAAMGPSWVQALVETATGADRLKAKTT